ncbi:MAG: hypothetical protein ACR2KZ_04235 [Segetibacter sp.]
MDLCSAYTMTEHNMKENAEAFSETEAGKVAVVCTPSGREKTVGIDLKVGRRNDRRSFDRGD